MTHPSGLRPHGPGYRRALLALFGAGIAAFTMVYVVQPLLPLVSADLGVNATRASLLLSASTLGIAVAVIPLALLAERVGRGRIMVLGLACAVAAGLLCAIAPGFGLMLLARGVQGAALAAVPAAALAWVAENISPTWVTRVAGLYIAGTSIGGMSGRLLGGVVAELIDWRTAMLLVTALAGVVTLATHLLLPAGRTTERSPHSAVHVQAARDPHRTTRMRLYLVAALGMAMFVGLYNVVGYRTQAPPFLLGTGLGSMFYLTYLAGTATSSLAGRLERRLGLRAALLAGIGAAAAGVLLTLPDSVVAIWLGLAVVAAGFFLVHAISSVTSARLSVRPTAGSGRYTFAYYAGSSVGGVLLGQAWDLGAWPGTAAAAAVLLVLLAVVVLGLPAHGASRAGRTSRPPGR